MYNTDLPTRAELPSAGRLLRSTVLAALTATVLLFTTVLPAEYGIDPTGVGRALGLTRMGEIKVSLAAEANTPAPVSTPAVPQPAGVTQAPAAADQPLPDRDHTVTIKLKPGEAAEIKLGMRKGATVRYEWIAAGGSVNVDAHGDPVGAPKDFYHGYGKARNKAGDAGTLQAAFDGKHGWFWRNRSGAEVTLTLKTRGDYDTIERVL